MLGGLGQRGQNQSGKIYLMAKSGNRPSNTQSESAAVDCGHAKLRGNILSWEEFRKSESPLAKVFAASGGNQLGSMAERSRTIDASTVAQVDTSGQLIEARHSTVARTAAGAALAGPLGAIIGHASKKKESRDTTTVYLTRWRGLV